MNFKDIKVGEEYAAGDDGFPYRARVLEVGTFKKAVHSGRGYYVHGRQVEVKGARVLFLNMKTGEPAMIRNPGFEECMTCKGTGKIDQPDRDFTDVMVQVDCGICDGRGKTREYAEVERVEWLESRKILRLWSAELERLAARRKYEAEQHSRYEANRDASSSDGPLAQALKAAELGGYVGYSSTGVTLNLTASAANRLAEIINTNTKGA